MHSLWIDFSSGEVERFDFHTEEQLNFFLDGACTMIDRLGLDDVMVFDSEEEMLAAYEDAPKIIVNPLTCENEAKSP